MGCGILSGSNSPPSGGLSGSNTGGISGGLSGSISTPSGGLSGSNIPICGAFSSVPSGASPLVAAAGGGNGTA